MADDNMCGLNQRLTRASLLISLIVMLILSPKSTYGVESSDSTANYNHVLGITIPLSNRLTIGTGLKFQYTWLDKYALSYTTSPYRLSGKHTSSIPYYDALGIEMNLLEANMLRLIPGITYMNYHYSTDYNLREDTWERHQTSHLLYSLKAELNIDRFSFKKHETILFKILSRKTYFVQVAYLTNTDNHPDSEMFFSTFLPDTPLGQEWMYSIGMTFEIPLGSRKSTP